MFPPTNECSGFCVPLICFPFSDVMLGLWHRILLSFSIFYLHQIYIKNHHEKKKQMWQLARDINAYREIWQTHLL